MAPCWQVQERSNKAAARYDKASSQHGAAKEMIRVAELQLEDRLKEIAAGEGPSSPSPLDAAWQEMLNHATIKVGVACSRGVTCMGVACT